MAVFDPNRRHNARGEQRRRELLRAAAVIFARAGYHEATTNAIAEEAGVSPATLYQFFPNKEAIASALASAYAREMAEAERKIDLEGAMSFKEAVVELLEFGMKFNRRRPEFHTLVMDAPLSADARKDKLALGQVFVEFIADRLRRERPAMPRSEAIQHGRVALLIFRGVLDGLTVAAPRSRRRLEQGMRDAVLRYLEPLVTRRKKSR